MVDVREQYEKWVYPLPLLDLDEAARNGHNDYSDPSIFRRKFWPRPTEPENLRILVAGCGTSQAAWNAYRNPNCEVVGIDLSQASLVHQGFLKDKHQLTNLHLRQLGILDVEALGEPFDLIISTGVLHHMPDPDAGLRALAAMLKPQGVMSIMVYGHYRRVGVYMMQEAFRLLGVEQTQAGVAQVRETLAALPAWHHVKSYANGAPDLFYDAGVVDTFLHPVDRAYTVPQVLRWAEDNGLRFQDWLDRHSYSLSGLIPETLDISPMARRLSLPEQWQLVELLGQSMGSHRFLLCRPERSPGDYVLDFAADDPNGEWLSYIPHLRPPLSVVRHSDPALRTPATLKRLFHEFTLDDLEAKMFESVDGRNTIAQIIEAAATGAEDRAEVRSRAFRLFARMHDWDHLMFQK